MEATEPTYQKDAVDDEFNEVNGVSLPKFSVGKLKSLQSANSGELGSPKAKVRVSITHCHPYPQMWHRAVRRPVMSLQYSVRATCWGAF